MLGVASRKPCNLPPGFGGNLQGGCHPNFEEPPRIGTCSNPSVDPPTQRFWFTITYPAKLEPGRVTTEPNSSGVVKQGLKFPGNMNHRLRMAMFWSRLSSE
uniref:Uncharacterized protein n=1 Tax=Moniliophthora roreri TaxID=221103 RepID=A0A0W0FHQ9_MONRR